MKLIRLDNKTGEAKIAVDTMDDLWHLEKILSVGDKVTAHSTRSVRIGTKEEKKHVKLTVAVESVEFSKSVNRLRVHGKIIWGEPEDFIQLGRYHTIDIEPGDKFAVVKEWKFYQLGRLKDAEKESKRPQVRIIVMDDEVALTAVLRGFGVDYGKEFHNSARKSDEKYEERTAQYLGDISAEIGNHAEKYVVAGPGFAKDNLKKFMAKRDPTLLKRIIFESCSYAERNGISELLKRGVIEKIAGEARLEQEEKMIEEFLTALNKGSGLVAYGPKEVAVASEMSAVSRLLVLDSVLRVSKEAEAIADNVGRSKGKVFILSEEGDAGMRLKGFGGIAAFLKFSVKSES